MIPANVARGTRTIPGLLWTPEGTQPVKALVLLGHGGGGDKRQGYILALARRLVRHHGYAAAAIDLRKPSISACRLVVETDNCFADDSNWLDAAPVWLAPTGQPTPAPLMSPISDACPASC